MITLDDILADTEFTDPQTYVKWKKGTTCLGYGKTGKTKCYPLKGGQFQTGEKFAVMLPNNMEVLV